MKRLAMVLVLLVALLAAAAAHAQVPTLEGQWHFDDSGSQDQVIETPDSSGHGYDLAVEYADGLDSNNQPGHTGKFHGAYGFYDLAWATGGGSLLMPAHVTALAWVKSYSAAAEPDYRYVISQGYGACTSSAYGLYTGPQSDPNHGGLFFYVHTTQGDFFAPSAAPSAVWDTNWHLVAGTYDGFKVHLYVDGTEIGSGTAVPAPIAYNQDHQGFNVGSYGGINRSTCRDMQSSFQGWIDEPRIYDQALTHNELSRLAGAAGPDAPALQPDAPAINNASIDQITATSARISGTLYDVGGALSSHVEIVKQSGGPVIYCCTQTIGGGPRGGTMPVSATMTGLDPDTDYRVMSWYPNGTGGTYTFHTLATGQVNFASATASVAENAGSVSLTVKRSSSTGSTSVSYATANGTASSSSDYTTTSGTLTFNAGETSKTIQVPITNDATGESPETFTVTLSNASGGAIASPSTATVTITDDDNAIRFSSSTASVNENAGTASLNVARSGDQSQYSSVTYTTTAGSAGAGSDYTTKSGTLQFSPNQQLLSIQVPIINDGMPESPETFTVTISSTNTGSAGSPSTETVTINDDDQPVHLAASSATVAESVGSVTLTAMRTGDASKAVAVDYVTVAGSATPGADYTAQSGSLSFAAGQTSKTIQVPIADDALAESDETFTVRLRDPNGTTLGSPSESTVTITDNDTVPDTTPPATTITFDPAAPPSGTTYLSPVTVGVAATDDAPGAIEIRCVLDPGSAPASFGELPAACPYTTPTAVAGLGHHDVYAAARDASGNTSAIAHRDFDESRAPETTITAGPTGNVLTTENAFSFSSDVAGATFECRVDSGAFTACTSPHTVTSALGAHTFAVRAIAPDGTADPTPATRSFTVVASSSVQADCVARPVWAPVAAALVSSPLPLLDACEIGTPGDQACASHDVCVVQPGTCPAADVCTLHTTVQWSDADTRFNWSVEAQAGIEPLAPYGFASVRDWSVQTCDASRCGAKYCQTGFDGSHCGATAQATVIGPGGPLFGGCLVNELYAVHYGGGAYYESSNGVPTGQVGSNGAVLGADSSRQLTCSVDWQIAPAQPLAPVVQGTVLQLYTDQAGVLSVVSTVASPLRQTRAIIASAPAIAPAHVRVKARRRVIIPLRLNAAAKKLLRKRGKLTARLRIRFTNTAGHRRTTVRRVTLTRPPVLRKPRCKVIARHCGARKT